MPIQPGQVLTSSGCLGEITEVFMLVVVGVVFMLVVVGVSFYVGSGRGKQKQASNLVQPSI